MATATTMFATAALAIPWLAPELAGHYYHPRIIALTHTLTLGWITLTIMGATYQLLPVVLERAVWSERLAWWQLGVLVVGIVGLVAHFWIGQRSGMAWAAGLVGVGVIAYLLNVGVSLRDLDRVSFTAGCMVAGFGGLALTTAFGVGLAVDRVQPFLPSSFFGTLHAHYHLAVLGWVAPMIVGVAARVYPMFLLAREPAGWAVRLPAGGLALGAPALIAGLLLDASMLVAAGALAVSAALIGHATWVVRIARARRRPALDWGLGSVLTATGFLGLATAMGLGLALRITRGPRIALAYAVLGLGGWISLTIVGMMLRIVPFLVWYRVYAPRVGRERVPPLRDLGWPRLEGLAWAGLTGGFLALAAAAAAGTPGWIRASGGLVALGAVAFAGALARVLWHLASPWSLAPPAHPSGPAPA
jgi:hypothetical protein